MPSHAVGFLWAVRNNRRPLTLTWTLAEAEEDRRVARLPDPFVNLPELIDAIDSRLADLAVHPEGPTLGPPELPRSAR